MLRRGLRVVPDGATSLRFPCIPHMADHNTGFFRLLFSIFPMKPFPIRSNRHGEYAPLVNRLTSKHRGYKIAVGTARRRQEVTGIPMGIVTWHDGNFVVMP